MNYQGITETASMPDCFLRHFETREAWKAARSSELSLMVGASEVASLFGCENAYDSQYSMWAKRVDPEAWVMEVERETDQMFWGKLVEDLIRTQYAEQSGADCRGWPQTSVCVAKDWPGFCTPDTICRDDDGPLIVEMKGFNEYDRKRWVEGPPMEIVLQNLHQQAVTGIHRGRIVVLFGNQIRRLGVYDVDYDESFVEGIKSRAIRFEHYVRKNIEPPVDESEMTARAIYRLHPNDNGETADLPVDADAWAVERAAIKAAIKGQEQRLEWLSNQLKASIGDATFGVTPGGQYFSWKTQTRTTIDSNKLRANYPDAAEECEKDSSCRVLLPLAKPPR